MECNSYSLYCYFIEYSQFSGSHQGTKTQRIDMSFNPLPEKEGRITRKRIGAVLNAFGIYKT